MKEYHKIQTVFYRDMENNSKYLVPGRWATPEFEYLQNVQWECEEKIDGTNVRVIFDGLTIDVRGKTDDATLHPTLVKNVRALFNDINLLNEVFPNLQEEKQTVCLYGEGFGPKIQKGGGNYTKTGIIKDMSYILFDIRIGNWWLQRQDVRNIAQRLHLLYTPVVYRGTLNQCIAFAEAGYLSTFGDFMAEGVIARPLVELKNRRADRIITKIKYKDFDRTKPLLNHDDMADAMAYAMITRDPVLGQLPPQE